MRERVLAERMAEEVRRIERIGTAAAARAAAVVRARVITNYEKRTAGRTGELRQLLFDDLKFKLRDALVVGHLLGLHRARLMQPAAKDEVPVKLSLGVYDAVIKHLNKLLKVDVEALQEQYGSQALRVVNDVSTKVEGKLRESVSGLISQGATVSEAKKVLGIEFQKAGIAVGGDHQLETVFRTQTQLAYSAGRWEADQAVDDILWGYKYVTVGDERVRPEHEALEGTTLPKDDPFWDKFFPPNGWNCRCQAISIFEERAKVRPDMTLEDGTPVQPDKGFEFNPGKVFGGVLE